MDQKNLIQSILPTLLLLFATIGGWIAKPVDFSKARPEAVSHASMKMHALQDVETRLWKDPFAGFPNKESLKDDHIINASFSRLTALQFQLKPSVPPEKPPLVIVSLVHSASTVFESESRLRQRHAVLAGLGVAGYVPVNENHIGLLAAPWDRKSLPQGPLKIPEPEKKTISPHGDYATPLIGAFEWFEPANPRRTVAYGDVLVLWLPEREFAETPMRRIAQLVDKLGRSETNNFPLVILGPRTTGGLFAFCEEAAAESGWCDFRRLGESVTLSLHSVLKGTQLYSASATTTDELLPPYVVPKSRQDFALRGRDLLTRQLEKLGGDFHDFAADDGAITALLARELQLRGVKPGDRDSILLLSEWHSDYGRALPLTFAANWVPQRRGGLGGFVLGDEGELPSAFGERIRAMQRNPETKFPQQLIRVGYVSGVDGDRKAVAVSASAGGEKQPNVSAPDAALYPAFGESQFDYIERLAAQLDREFGEPKDAGEKRGRVVAIGVLGSDFYDKLHLVQALRPKFPQALFFTTDLDARMLAADTRRWMKNLLVGSSWSLEPTSSLVASIPPFRDSYQTAIFHAVKAALIPQASTTRPPVDVFEIGRTLPVRLSNPKEGVENAYDVLARQLALFMGCTITGGVIVWQRRRVGNFYRKEVRPKRTTIAIGAVCVAFVAMAGMRNANGMLLVCLGVILVVGLNAFALPTGDLSRSEGAAHPFAVVLGCVGAVLFLVLVCWIVVPKEALLAEPFYWLEGVSVWPAEIVRISAGLLGVYWIWATHREVLGKGRELTERYGLETQDSLAPAGTGEAVKATALWNDYRDRLQMDVLRWLPRNLHQANWVWIGTSVLMVFWLYFAYWQPEPLRAPYRGTFSYVVDVVVVFLVMLVYTFLLLQVFDVSRKTRSFIHDLAQKPTEWPTSIVRESVGDAALKTAGPNVDGWLDVRFVAELTHTVGDLVIRPFVILFLLLAATSHDFFDTWSMNQPYIVTLSVVNAALPLLCGYFLCREAEKARSAAAARLQDALIKAEAPDLKGKYELMLREIKECRRGAFRPIYEQPYVIALLIPLGGSGSIEIIKRLLNG